ncbi:MAG: 2-oxoacid:ferredoxin oxidoreductase subunit beta, partial [Planctomycetota bacterium]|nr:2-oxoacid:ferredoxin oxidoreductase subunit beta [Planctomycetota bacterium]
VLRAVSGIPTYDDQINEQVAAAEASKGKGDLNQLFNAGDTWTVE